MMEWSIVPCPPEKETPQPYTLWLPPTLLVMQQREIVPFLTQAPAPFSDCARMAPPVRTTPSSFAPSSSIAQRWAVQADAFTTRLMTVFSQPWPASVTPPVTLSCASM